MAAETYISIADAVWEIGVAVLFTVTVKLALDYKAHRLGQDQSHGLATEDYALFTLICLLSITLKDIYPPVITAVALGAIYFAVEHLGSLQSHGSSVQSKFDDLDTDITKKFDRIEEEVNKLLDRLGAEQWSQIVQDALPSDLPIFAVYSVWDILPLFPSSDQQKSTNLLAPRVGLSRNVKTTFVARTAIELNEYIFPSVIPDDLNALSLLNLLTKAYQANEQLLCLSEGIFSKLRPESTVLSATDHDLLIPIIREALSLEHEVLEILEISKAANRRYRTISISVNGKLQIINERCWAILCIASTSAPYITILGSSKASIQKQTLSSNTLERARAVVLVPAKELGSTKHSTASVNYGTGDSLMNPGAIQAKSPDYAFNFIGTSSPNEASKKEFANEVAAAPTRIALRSLERLLRSEFALSASCDVYMTGKVLWKHHARGGDSILELSVETAFSELIVALHAQASSHVTQVSVKNVFETWVDIRISQGERKNGEANKRYSRLAKLIWANL